MVNQLDPSSCWTVNWRDNQFIAVGGWSPEVPSNPYHSVVLWKWISRDNFK